MLNREQERITGELDLVNRRLDAHHGKYTDARARMDDANRRLCNQAFFIKV